MADPLPLAGLTVGITAERRADEQARLFADRGAATVHGPALRVTSAGDDDALRAATEAVVRDPPDLLLASTGFGMKAWLEAADGWGLRAAVVEALGRARVANRGAKAASANAAVGLREWYRAPNERFDELLTRVLAERLDGARVVLQLHGTAMPRTVARLTAAGAEVIEVDAYRASLPEDRGPALALAEAACAGRLAAVTFTTAPAVHNLFVIAAAAGLDADLRRALDGPVLAACVGPVCAEGAVEEGVSAPLVPERSRLVPLVAAVTERLSAAPRP